MAGVAEAKKSFWTLIDSWKAKRSATLTLKSVNGELRARLEINLGHHEHDQAKLKTRAQRVGVFNFGTDRVRVLEKIFRDGSGTDRVRVFSACI